MKIGLYPGSFDPFTIGHMDILRRACSMLDEVIVAVLIKSAKTPYFSLDERLAYIQSAAQAEGLTNVRTGFFEGLLVDYAHKQNAHYLVRGLRAVTDFEYEFQINAMNRRLAADIDTLYFMADPEHSFLSSSIVKEVGSLGGSIAGLVPEVNRNSIIERLAQQHAAN